MSNIASAFSNRKAFIAFITCGDPDLATTAAAVRAAVQNGADLIELGIPFSDPTAEGPVIQGDRTDRRADDEEEERTEQIQVRRSQLAIFNGVYIMKNTKNGIGENACSVYW